MLDHLSLLAGMFVAVMGFTLVVLFVVVRLGRRWPLVPPIVGACFFVTYLVYYLHLSSEFAQFAGMFDNSLFYNRVIAILAALFWFGVAVWGTVAALRTKSGAAVAERLRNTIRSVATPPTVNEEVLTNALVTGMVQAGLGEQVILEKVRYSRCAFSLSSTDLTGLKAAGVSDSILAAMLDAQARRGSATLANAP